jgi:hypothetical protein
MEDWVGLRHAVFLRRDFWLLLGSAWPRVNRSIAVDGRPSGNGGSIEMTQQHTPAGWYPDPTGRYESRYFDGQWTEHVATRGVNSIDPVRASSAPSASTPYGPLAQSGPGMPPPYVQSAPGTGKGSPRFKLAIAGGVVAVAVGITLAVALTGGGSGGHGFCADVTALGNEYPSKLSAADLKNGSKLSHIASQFDRLAAESASPKDAGDLRYVASWLRKVASGDLASAEASQTRLAAAGNRVTTYINETCPGVYVGGG